MLIDENVTSINIFFPVSYLNKNEEEKKETERKITWPKFE